MHATHGALHGEKGRHTGVKEHKRQTKYALKTVLTRHKVWVFTYFIVILPTNVAEGLSAINNTHQNKHNTHYAQFAKRLYKNKKDGRIFKH